MAMSSELSRLQFYNRAQSLLDTCAADKARIAELENLARLASDSIVQLSEALTTPSDTVTAANDRGEYEAIADMIDAALAQQGKEGET
tara:strand:- start:273 stop:536 length:264 start_codon:yes stop_codon:yes gene_type:complete